MRLAALLLVLAAPAWCDVARLDWLSGCWSYDNAEAGSGEYWMTPSGGMMLAVSRTVRTGRKTSFEFIRVADTEDGLALFASPGGRETTRFDLARISEHEVVFENTHHDFPQRVIYRLLGSNSLLGRIEGTAEGEEVAVDFPMTRVNCQLQPT